MVKCCLDSSMPFCNKYLRLSDSARFTRLGSTLKSIHQHYGEGLIWPYATLENGVHISYPGHGGYPTGYDPRQRPWYKMAKNSNTPTWLPIVDATTRQLILTLSMPFRRQDGSLSGVAAMDIKITHAPVESETTSRWSQKMSSFIVGAETDSNSKKRKVWVISSQEKTSTPGSKPIGEIASGSPEIGEHVRMSNALGLAQEVQQSLLPQKDPSLPGFDIAGASIYCDETGGRVR